MKSSKGKKSVTINVIWNAVLSLSNILFPLITFPYVTRVLGVEANGANTFASSTVNYYALFATLGISTYGVKVCAEVKNDKTKLSTAVQELLLINTISTAIVIVALIGSIFLIPAFSNYKILMLIYGVNMIFNVFGINWLYQGIEKFRYITTRSVIFKFISIILMFLFVKTPSDVAKYAAITVFATSAGNILNIIYSHNYITLKKSEKYEIAKHIKPILYLFATALAVNIYSHMDSVMLGLFCGDYATGIYTVAVKVKTVLITLVSSFSVVIMSRLSYVKTNDSKSLIPLLKKSYSTIVMLTIALVIFFTLFSKESILLLSGKAFLEASTPMKILMPTIFISAVSQILGNQYSVSIGKEKNLMIAVIGGAITNLVANAILIPHFSYNGAAIGTIIAETTQCIIQIALAKNVVKEIFSIKKLAKALFSVGISAAISFGISHFITFNSTFITLAFNAVIFFGVYFVILLILKYDICIELLSSIKKALLSKLGKSKE